MSQLGVIDGRVLYSKEEFLMRTGISDRQFERMKKDGMNVSSHRKREYVLGDDFSAFLSRVKHVEDAPPRRQQSRRDSISHTEFEVQAVTYARLLDLGYSVRGELILRGCRFDLLVFHLGSPAACIEVKAFTTNTDQQLARYAAALGEAVQMLALYGMAHAMAWVGELSRYVPDDFSRLPDAPNCYELTSEARP